MTPSIELAQAANKACSLRKGDTMTGPGHNSRKRPPVKDARQRKADAGTADDQQQQDGADDDDGDIATPKYDPDYENDG